MRDQDKLRAYLKELPREEPSDNFTVMVMDRVRMEVATSPTAYQPLINRQSWWKILTGMLLFFIGAVIYRTYFPGNEQVGILQPLFQVDYSFLLRPFQLLSESMVRVPLTFVTGFIAVTALLLVDQLYSRFTSR
jgi:hypothetical protein